METVKKSVNSWVYRFITRDKVFGIAEGYSRDLLNTTCDIRKYFILSCLRTVFMPLIMALVLPCVLYATILHPILVIVGVFIGANISTGAYVVAGVFVVMDLFILVYIFQEYGWISKVLTRTSDVISEGFEIIKSKVCSKVEWVEGDSDGRD